MGEEADPEWKGRQHSVAWLPLSRILACTDRLDDAVAGWEGDDDVRVGEATKGGEGTRVSGDLGPE